MISVNRNMPARYRGILACCLIAILAVPGVLNAEDQKEAKLSFAITEGELLNYQTSWAMEYYYMGMDIVQNQSYDVEMKLTKVTEDGNYLVSLAFTGASSSMVVDDDIQDWSPPMQLEGESIMVEVKSNGGVLNAKPGGNIPGMHSTDELKSIAEIWFIELPDTVKRVGDSWRKNIEEGGGETEDGEKREPNAKGFADLTFKKIEKRKGIPVAVIEVESKLEINQAMPGGILRGKGEGSGRYYIAIEGGYIVEGKSEFELKGKVVSDDGKETDTAITRYYETKLKK
ncbi:MAG TPA: hypothetical protein VMX58_07640 [Patescibacteria group bacterium]|nr:hypothetical protein [Patescibacteria group bacterium]